MAIISFWLKIKFGLIITHQPQPASTAGRWFPTEDLPRQQASKQTSCWPPASHAGSQPPAYLSEFSHFRMFLYVIIIYAYYPSRRSFIITAHLPLSSLLITFFLFCQNFHAIIIFAMQDPGLLHICQDFQIYLFSWKAPLQRGDFKFASIFRFFLRIFCCDVREVRNPIYS